ncbi:MAG TPA: peptidoglycan bridge formation glycyltransferase FemA/FemB family protein [Candidatus Saccharimonadales bacterium]|nr:peptidoglycan bridge formation glycyltransferase FemA/FemB family protein [Candidatus Saccharimonadales bacterium]
MEVKDLNDKEVWEDFSLKTSPNNFLQSWNWGEFSEQVGKKTFRYGIYQGSELIGICLAILVETKLGNYLYVPRGPILKDWQNREILNVLLVKLKEISAEQKCIFIKIEPAIEEKEENRALFANLGFQSSVAFTQVEDAWLVDLSKSEEELLMEMRKTTRYLVRNEPKQGVTVEISDQQEDAEKFVEMLFATSERKGFVNHSKDYYLKQFEILSKDNEMRIFKAKNDGKVLAMAMISFYGEMASYLHGASEKTDQSVGYSLQWEAIKEAKRRGLKYYNFWGVVKDKNFKPGHPWYGFSLFKRGFGGFKYSYLRAQDLPLSPKYYLYRYAEKLRRLRSRLQTGYWED